MSNKRILLLLATFLPLWISAQDLDVAGKATIRTMDKVNTADSIVVRLADGTLAVRDVSTLKELPSSPSLGEILYFNGATWFLLSPGTQNQTLTICNGVPTWEGCSATLNTTSVTSIGGYSATGGGSIINGGSSPVTARGVCWSIDINPDINGDHTDEGAGDDAFSSDMTALSENTAYYVRAYVTSAVGTAYGNEVSFMTLPNALATLTTKAITALGAYSATSGGTISDSGGPPVTAVGVCWSTSINPDINGAHTNEGAGDGEFSSKMDSLTENTTYYVRAYATNAVGTAYGNEVGKTEHSFMTLPATLATLTTTAITLLGGNSVTTGGNISGLGGSPVTARGVCWSTSMNPTISGSHSVDGSAAGPFQTTITGLGTYSTYHIRAYATNGTGTAYGNDVVFTTLVSQLNYPIVSTAPVTYVGTTIALCGGTVSAVGSSPVSARGVCWSTSINPDIDGSHTVVGAGAGNFLTNINGLIPFTTYYVRAYATSLIGTSYGNEVSFTTETLSIGDQYRGGIIAYILQAGDTNYVGGEIHGLIAAPSDQKLNYTFFEDPLGKKPTREMQWGCYGNYLGANGTGLGTGSQNTMDIVESCSTSRRAARNCSNKDLNGYDDWYLPSKDELNKLFLARHVIGGFANNYYWSSTESDSDNAWARDGGSGYQFTNDKSTYYRVRAVRAF